MKLKEIFLAGLVCASMSMGQVALGQAEQVSEEELVAAAERMLAQEAGAESEVNREESETTSTVKVDNRKESEIPVFSGTESKKIVEAGSWKRMAMSVAMVLILGGGLYYGVQRFARKASVQNQKLKMDVITQHHFSPKRSLIVVRVAGEHLLIGATDHSMNLIKSISLIDDEAEGNLPQDFNNFLEDDFVEQSITDSRKRRTFSV